MTDTARSRAEIEAELAAARQRLAGSVESLFLQIHPRAVVHNTVADARTLVTDRAKAVKAEFVAPDGSLRTRRVALVAAAVGGSLAFIAVVRSILRG
jgi:alpha-glucuronidase